MPTINDIINEIERLAPPALQESWDNTGWQLLPVGTDEECRSLTVCVDVTPEVVDETIAAGSNLIVSHHPLIFKGLRSLTGATPQQRALLAATRAGVAIYSSHTALDSADGGVNTTLARRLGLVASSPLAPTAPGAATGLGAVGNLAEPMSREEFIGHVKRVYGSPRVRVTRGTGRPISRVALCGGSGGEFITAAIAAGADAYVTSDVRYHDFLDHGREILIVDTGHFESENCTKSIFSEIISEKFPNFAVRMSTCEHNPVDYI